MAVGIEQFYIATTSSESKRRALKKAFRHSDRITGLYLKTFAATAREAFGIYSQNFILSRCPPASNTDSFRRSNPGIASGHRDRLQKIDTVRAAFRHVVASRAIHLAENGEAPLGITDERDVDFRVDQIIASVELGDPGGGLGQGKPAQMHRTQ